MIGKIGKLFSEKFSQEPLIIRSPGRVNIIGEHTDYNDGFVLPAAIDKSIYAAVAKRNDNGIHLFAVNFNESFETTIAAIQPSSDWPTYILGVVDQLLKHNHTIGGFNLVLDGDIPPGAGLSSSAAVECAIVFALNELFELGIDKMQIVKMAQMAEHTYAGVKCGIMDQFASMFGKKDHAIKLDCRSLQYEYIPLNLEGYKLVLFNTNVKHSLASSEYNVRRQQCEAGVELLLPHYQQVKNLRDVAMPMLDEYVKPEDELIYRRCKYVVEENERLTTACNDLMQGNVKELGKKMFATHEGLSKDYEVSCKELDFLVDAVKGNTNVLGARMMGGGFGGCTINIIKDESIKEITETLAKEYNTKMGMELTAYIVQTNDGTSVVTT
ncbi:MAG: galactokinase [Bacteroidota bacterium]